MKRFLLSFLVSTIIFSACFFSVDRFMLPKENLASSMDDHQDLVKDEPSIEDFSEEELEQANDKIQFVLMGIDDGGLKVEKGVRSDTIIAFDVNFKTGKIKGLTIPRDSRVDVRGRKNKINHAHSFGGKELAMTTINDFLGTNIKYYVRVDFKGVMDIVDAIGGVKMDVPVNMNYDDPTAKPELHIHLKKGDQLLSGKESHDVLRFRHNNGQDYYPGGYSREQVQQMWLKCFIKSALQPKNIMKLPSLIETYFNSVDTNIPMLDIFSYGLKAGNIDPSLMEMYTVPEEEPGRIIGGAWYYLPDELETKKLADRIFKEDFTELEY